MAACDTFPYYIGSEWNVTSLGSYWHTAIVLWEEPAPKNMMLISSTFRFRESTKGFASVNESFPVCSLALASAEALSLMKAA